MDLGLTGKRALVLASSRGLGLGIAEAIAAEGADVLITGRDGARLEAAVAAIRWTFGQFPDLPRIISTIDPANAKSQAVAAKIGEEKTGETFGFMGFTLDIWAAGREGWLSRFG